MNTVNELAWQVFEFDEMGVQHVYIARTLNIPTHWVPQLLARVHKQLIDSEHEYKQELEFMERTKAINWMVDQLLKPLRLQDVV